MNSGQISIAKKPESSVGSNKRFAKKSWKELKEEMMADYEKKSKENSHSPSINTSMIKSESF